MRNYIKVCHYKYGKVLGQEILFCSTSDAQSTSVKAQALASDMARQGGKVVVASWLPVSGLDQIGDRL